MIYSYGTCALVDIYGVQFRDIRVCCKLVFDLCFVFRQLLCTVPSLLALMVVFVFQEEMAICANAQKVRALNLSYINYEAQEFVFFSQNYAFSFQT